MDLRIGTSGFQFESWKPAVYPHRLKKSEMFDYYCGRLGFDCLELNATFYHLPNPKAMETLARRAPEGFLFIAKLHHGLTHRVVGRLRRQPPASWQELNSLGRALGPACPTSRGTACRAPTPLLLSRLFYRSIQPLRESGKLDGVLAQFPPSFLPGEENCDYLRFMKDEAGQLPLFVEFRHRDWTRQATFDFLRREGIGYCATDLPRLGSLPQFTPVTTTEGGYFRLHGRSPDWFRDPDQRYRYSYSDRELSHFLQTARRFASTLRQHPPARQKYGGREDNRLLPGADRVYIFFNNCHAGAAIRNAKRAREMLHATLPVGT